jgi:hypothetical protein
MAGFKDMKKHWILAVLFLTAYFGYGEELLFRVIRDTPCWTNIDFPRRNNIRGYLKKGTVVAHGDGSLLFSAFGVPPEKDWELRLLQNIVIFYDGRETSAKVSAEDLVPAGAVELFDQSYLRGVNERWVVAFYLEALIAGDRDLIREAQLDVWEDWVTNVQP